jgi:DnaJ like chaperone protein
MYRWIGAIFGFIFLKTPGMFVGFLIGYFLDNLNIKTRTYQQSAPRQGPTQATDFEINLLSLCAIVIKADQRVSDQEMRFVQQYFVQQFGRERANQAFRQFNQFVKNHHLSIPHIGQRVRVRTTYETRLQILHFLFHLAQADGQVSDLEVTKIDEIRGHLAINFKDFESIKAMFFQNPDSAYKILETDRNASVEDIKKAYRTMAKKYHPDKLQHLDEAYRKGAEEKFRKVQEAYEQIRQERGF